jgi:hypothetical protein
MVVDLPGMIGSDHEKDTKQQIDSLVDEYLKKAKANNNIVLAVLDSTQASMFAQATTRKITEKGMIERTVGVLTRVDENKKGREIKTLRLRMLGDKEEIPQLCEQDSYSKCKKPSHGYYGVYNRDTEDDEGNVITAATSETVSSQVRVEEAWFAKTYEGDSELMQRAGIARLLAKLNSLLTQTIREKWLPSALRAVCSAGQQTAADLSKLGLPPCAEVGKIARE